MISFLLVLLFTVGTQGFLPGTCEGACGGQSNDGCWCDESCESSNDCCEDISSVCTFTPPISHCRNMQDETFHLSGPLATQCSTSSDMSWKNVTFVCDDMTTPFWNTLFVNVNDGVHFEMLNVTVKNCYFSTNFLSIFPEWIMTNECTNARVSIENLKFTSIRSDSNSVMSITDTRSCLNVTLTSLSVEDSELQSLSFFRFLLTPLSFSLDSFVVTNVTSPHSLLHIISDYSEKSFPIAEVSNLSIKDSSIDGSFLKIESREVVSPFFHSAEHSAEFLIHSFSVEQSSLQGLVEFTTIPYKASISSIDVTDSNVTGSLFTIDQWVPFYMGDNMDLCDREITFETITIDRVNAVSLIRSDWTPNFRLNPTIVFRNSSIVNSRFIQQDLDGIELQSVVSLGNGKNMFRMNECIRPHVIQNIVWENVDTNLNLFFLSDVSGIQQVTFLNVRSDQSIFITKREIQSSHAIALHMRDIVLQSSRMRSFFQSEALLFSVSMENVDIHHSHFVSNVVSVFESDLTFKEVSVAHTTLEKSIVEYRTSSRRLIESTHDEDGFIPLSFDTITVTNTSKTRTTLDHVGIIDIQGSRRVLPIHLSVKRLSVDEWTGSFILRSGCLHVDNALITVKNTSLHDSVFIFGPSESIRSENIHIDSTQAHSIFTINQGRSFHFGGTMTLKNSSVPVVWDVPFSLSPFELTLQETHLDVNRETTLPFGLNMLTHVVLNSSTFQHLRSSFMTGNPRMTMNNCSVLDWVADESFFHVQDTSSVTDSRVVDVFSRHPLSRTPFHIQHVEFHRVEAPSLFPPATSQRILHLGVYDSLFDEAALTLGDSSIHNLTCIQTNQCLQVIGRVELSHALIQDCQDPLRGRSPVYVSPQGTLLLKESNRAHGNRADRGGVVFLEAEGGLEGVWDDHENNTARWYGPLWASPPVEVEVLPEMPWPATFTSGSVLPPKRFRRVDRWGQWVVGPWETEGELRWTSYGGDSPLQVVGSPLLSVWDPVSAQSEVRGLRIFGPSTPGNRLVLELWVDGRNTSWNHTLELAPCDRVLEEVIESDYPACVEARCPQGCVHGTCTAHTVCTCHSGWVGDRCDLKPALMLHQSVQGNSFVVVSAGTGLCIVACYGYFVAFRRLPLFKRSGILFMSIMTAGLLLMDLSVIPVAIGPTPSCYAWLWMLSLGISFVLLTLLAKQLMFYIIFNKTLDANAEGIKQWKFFLRVSCGLIPVVILLVAITVGGSFTLRQVIFPPFQAQVCVASTTVTQALLYCLMAYVLLLLLGLVLLAWKLRNIPVAYRESEAIGYITSFITFVMIVMVPLIASGSIADASVSWIIIFSTIVLCSLGIMLLFFGFKVFYHLTMTEEERKLIATSDIDEVIYNPKTHRMESKKSYSSNSTTSSSLRGESIVEGSAGDKQYVWEATLKSSPVTIYVVRDDILVKKKQKGFILTGGKLYPYLESSLEFSILTKQDLFTFKFASLDALIQCHWTLNRVLNKSHPSPLPTTL